ncbi:MAG: hypothetical protein ABI725_04380 [Chloroflexota bacterium]
MTSRGSLPEIGEMVADGRLRLQRPDRSVLLESLAAARNDLVAANSNAAAFPAWAETMLYEAGLRCARTIVQAAGYRIAAERGHVTAIDAADTLTASNHRLFVRLHRMRRQRHEFMYESAPEPSLADLDQGRKDVEALIRLVEQSMADVT